MSSMPIPPIADVCDGWLWNINEIFWSNLSYPNMILVGVKALATSQMNGADIQVMVDIVHDIGSDTVIPPQLAAYEHDNPAIVGFDVLANPTYGALSACQYRCSGYAVHGPI